jgi:radical SAM superfamily enzyme YgiQ (UPF0313 family)
LKILLVYPQYPDTFWSFKHALKFISKKASHPPLGLLTVAAMLPDEWNKKLVDMNVTTLKDRDIEWADYVFISAMVVQRDSARETINRCHALGTKVVAGGPLFTCERDEFDEVDHLVLDEGEITLPPFLEDLQKGQAKHIYTSSERPDINNTPIPQWSLIDMKNYSSMSIQYSRGCPYNCEFCNVVILNGHKPRTKSKEQMIAEIDAIYNRGWRESLFIVDDNFIGNKKKLKSEILPAIIEWRRGKKRPFFLNTETSINLADDDELLKLMIEAGFNAVFVGIETPNEESLVECAKSQNRNRDLQADIRKLHNAGFEVQAGFIVGFDHDPLSIFKSQISFIQKSGIVTAMVSLLSAPPGTRLYQRLKKENRIVKAFDGSTTECNIIPKMNYNTLIEGYKHILTTIYSPKPYYERLATFLKEYNPYKNRRININFGHIRVLWKTFWILGIGERGRRYYWKVMLATILKRPRAFPMALKLSIYGYHFRRVIEKYIGTKLVVRETEKSVG